MLLSSSLKSILEEILPPEKVIVGFPQRSLRAPYLVIRPLFTDPGELSLDGRALYWDDQHSVYCCGNSVESSARLSRSALQALQGAYVDGSTLTASIASGTIPVEGLYETHIIVTTITPTL